MDATHQLVCARLGDSASTVLKLFLFSLCSTLLMSTKSKPQTPPPPELFRFAQGFLHLSSDLIITSPLYGNPTLLILTKQPETRHFSPSQSLDSSFRMDVAALRRSLLSQSRIYENLTLLVLRRSCNCGTTNEHINLGRVRAVVHTSVNLLGVWGPLPVIKAVKPQPIRMGISNLDHWMVLQLGGQHAPHNIPY